MKNKVPLSEYPRMIMVRNSFYSLNGVWEYAITRQPELPSQYDGEINVPFSPETPLSGVNRFVGPDDYLIYRKRFTLDANFLQDVTILHFGAVDQIATIYLNDTLVGQNEGGFMPFSLDISKAVKTENELIVVVKDYTDTKFYSRGKQKIKRGQIWYSPQSGIYLPVWIESMPSDYIESLKITPKYDEGGVEITVYSQSKKDITLTFNEKQHALRANEVFFLAVPNFISWSPKTPYLYPFSVQLGEDFVTSYFAMRKISVETAKDGHKRIFLNNKVLFHTGLLDQGYYHDGYLTPTNIETLINDIKVAKAMGFNVLRKHIKIEWEPFYYHCDRLGMMVWQDFVNGGEKYSFNVAHVPAFLNIHYKDTNYKRFGRSNPIGRKQFYDEVEKTIKHLYNYPSIVLWTVFNEGWGQFDSHKLLKHVQKLDNSRLIDLNSGWHDQKLGDFKSRHVYFRAYKHRIDPLGRATILSEFGGFSYKVEGHYFGAKNFGYKKLKDKVSFTKAFIKLYEKEIIPSVCKGLAAAIYTQLSDVEDELNGLVTYNRKVLKIDTDVVLNINKTLTDQDN